jgi:ribosomal protein L29
MEMNELKKKSPKELQALLASEREKLLQLNFKDASKQLKNVREIRIARQTIARILTLLNEARMGREEQEEAQAAEVQTQ